MTIRFRFRGLALAACLTLATSAVCVRVAQAANTGLAEWGDGYYGQLGNGGNVESNVPVLTNTSGVLAGKIISKVAGGDGHSLALCADGTLAAWGYNGYGQLGTGDFNDSNVPVAVTKSGALQGKRVTAIAAGAYHSLALCSDGTLATWGSSYNGALGDGPFSVDSNVPVLVDRTGVLRGKTVAQIGAGVSYNVVLCTDGTLAAWGDNSYGQLGNGSFLSASTPVLVSLSGVLRNKKIVSLVVGGGYALVLCTDGTLASWGSNSSGELGDGTNSSTGQPVLVDRGGVLRNKTIKFVAAMLDHSLAVCTDGTLATWGSNFYGELGNNTFNDSNVPVAVINNGVLDGKNVFAASGGHCYITVICTDGSMASWGNNHLGQLGIGNFNLQQLPQPVVQSGVLSGRSVKAVASGYHHTLALYGDVPNGIISVSDVSVQEGNSGTVNAVFSVNLSQPIDNTITVQYATSPSGSAPATAGTDYTARSGTITFAPNQTQQTIVVPVKGDMNVESDETFQVTLLNSTNATIATATATCTIVNDDFAPVNVSLSPNTGTTNLQIQRKFTAVYSHQGGVGSITGTRLLINALPQVNGAFCATYNATDNKLYVLGDNGTTFLGGFAPGSANKISNSRGTLDCATTTVAKSGTVLTMVWGVQPKIGLTGPQNIYLYNRDALGHATPYQRFGTWTVTPLNSLPINYSCSPGTNASNRGDAYSLTTSFQDRDGVEDIFGARLLVNFTPTEANAIGVTYNMAQNKLYLLSDDGKTNMGGFEPGSANIISNKRGSLNCALTTVQKGTDTLVISWNLTPTAEMRGTHNLYLYVRDNQGGVDNYEKFGTWTISATNSAPTNEFAFPDDDPSTSGVENLIQTAYDDENGAGDLLKVRLLVSPQTGERLQLWPVYDVQQNKLYLVADDGVTLLGGYAPGSKNKITTSAGTLNCEHTLITPRGTTLYVDWALTPTASFIGTKKLYLNCEDKMGAAAPYSAEYYTEAGVQFFTWTIRPATLKGNPAPTKPSAEGN